MDGSSETISAVARYNARAARTIPRMAAAIAVLAHQGGWDEILLVTVPIVAIIAVLAVAKRRVDKIDHTRKNSTSEPDNP
jgi:hypothetical protein